MARKSQHSFQKRQREQKKAEKAAQKRARKAERKDAPPADMLEQDAFVVDDGNAEDGAPAEEDDAAASQ